MYEEEKSSVLGRIFTYLIIASAIFILSCFIFRSYKMSDIPLCDDILCDEEISAAYSENSEDFKVYTYGLRKRFESVGANQLLQLKYLYYIPSAKQMQITVKYNTSYAEPAEEKFPFELILKNEKSEILDDYYYEYGEKYGYGYIRISFCDVEIEKDSEYTLYVYLPKENEESQLLGKFILQDANSAYQETKLTVKNAPFIFDK